MAETDSIVGRVRRMRSNLAGHGDPGRVQAAVDGTCPDCDERFVVAVRSDISTVTCPGCAASFAVA